MTGEQRFSRVMNQFCDGAKHVYHEVEMLGDVPKGMKPWILNKEDWTLKYGLNRSFLSHLNHRHGMSLQEYVNSQHWVFSHFETEEERLKAYLNGGTLLFCDTKECDKFASHPFSRPLADIMEDIIQKRVDEAVKRERRIWELEEKNKEMR